jgi:hypothetical protein
MENVTSTSHEYIIHLPSKASCTKEYISRSEVNTSKHAVNPTENKSYWDVVLGYRITSKTSFAVPSVLNLS